MIWYKNLYVGESISQRKAKVKWNIRHNVGQVNIFVITLAANPKNLLEIISSIALMQRGYPKSELFVVGIAKEYGEAEELAIKIIMEVYEKTGGFNVRKYLLEKHGDKKAGAILCP